jgi:hypothetical protein
MHSRRWFPMIAVLALTAGACGGDDDSEVVYTPEELGTALLTADDIGTGWTEENRLVTDTRPEGMPVLDPGMWCPAAEAVPGELESLVADGGAFVELLSDESTRAGGNAAGRNFHGISQQLWSNADAEAFVETVADGFEVCTGETWEVDEGTTATVAELDTDDVGDDSTTALVTYLTPTPGGDYAWTGRQLVARFGATVMVLQELDVQLVDSDPFFTDDDWQRIVDTAVDRVDDLGDS